MGMITITFAGSLVGGVGPARATFSAVEFGHAAAVAQAIAYLAGLPMQAAIASDHKLQAEGCEPNKGFAGIGSLLPTKALGV